MRDNATGTAAISPVHFDDGRIRGLVAPRRAVDAIEAALRAGLRVAEASARQRVRLTHGEFLLMPAEHGGYAGVKVTTVAPTNPAAGLPRIQATYLLFDALTLGMVATLDGASLTALRTPAVSFAAVRPLLDRRPSMKVVGFGWGPQGVAHQETLKDLVGEQVELIWVARDPGRAREAVGRGETVVAAGSADAESAVGAADLIICATSSRAALFDGSVVRDDAVVIAVGSHTPDARELDGSLMGRAHVVVEDAATALREAGDVVMAIDEGALNAGDLVDLSDIVTGRVQLRRDRPTVFKSTGMAWQDLVIATEVVAADRQRAG